MANRHTIWNVGKAPTQLREASLPSEQLLEDMIVASPAILSDQWMIIGRQENTGISGRIDLLAIAPDGTLVLIELKRDRTPREVVAQAIDYATWVEGLDAQDISQIYARFAPGHDLGLDFRERFNQQLDEETINQGHSIVIVAGYLDASSKRIVEYLNNRDIPINVLFFQVFDTENGQLLSRDWLLDPAETQVAAATTNSKNSKEPWNGEYYVSFGEGPHRTWSDGMKYGFVSAGGGSWYSNTLNLLKPGDRIWVRVPSKGFVGVGVVKGNSKPIADFKVVTPEGQEKAALDVLETATYLRMQSDDPEKMEYFVPVDWLQTVPLDKAFNETGLFGNQNTVCAPKSPKWNHTVARLKDVFPRYADASVNK